MPLVANQREPGQSTNETLMLLVQHDGVKLLTDPEHLQLYLTIELDEDQTVDGEALLCGIRRLLEEGKISLNEGHSTALDANLYAIGGQPRSVEELLLIALPGAIHGQDAAVDWHIDIAPEEDASDDPIDIHAVKNWVNVSKDDVLFTLGEALVGVDGVNLHGEKLEATQGKDVPVDAYRGCRYQDRSCVATVSGAVIFANAKVTIDPTMNVKGDLSFEVGNIDFNGSVHISGSVPTGFQVITTGDLFVGGVIKGAELQVGGSLQVRGGITDDAVINVEGDIKSTYIHQSIVRAQGSVKVAREIMHSVVRAGGSVLAGRATIIGKNVSAGDDLEVGSAGSRDEITTFLMAGASPKVADCIINTGIEQSKIDAEIAEITEKGGEKLEPDFLKTLKGPARQFYRTMSRKRDKLCKERDALEDAYRDLLQMESALRERKSPPCILISKERHPKVDVLIGKSAKQSYMVHIAGRQKLLSDPGSLRVIKE